VSGSLALAQRDPRGRFAPGAPLEVRLWAKVAGPWNTPDIADEDCWYFGGRSRNRWGYPRIWWPDADGRLVIGAHVAAYIVTYGDVPAGLVVCHRCHHKMCCNPSHLYADTQSANVKQTWRAGGCRRARA
jgi:HNH endonuclease